MIAASLVAVVSLLPTQSPPSDAPRLTTTVPSPAAPASTLKSEDERILYALGLSIGRSVGVFSLTPEELVVVQKGMADAVNNKEPEVDLKTYGPKVQQLAQLRNAAKAREQKNQAKAYLEKAAKEPGAMRTGSGLIYREVKAGSGPQPKATDTVKVHYRGTLTDGTEFDSSYSRGQPAEFPLNAVIPCWTEAVQKMKVGGKAKLVCPSDIGYGDRGAPPEIPGGATLLFDVELIEIKKG